MTMEALARLKGYFKNSTQAMYEKINQFPSQNEEESTSIEFMAHPQARTYWQHWQKVIFLSILLLLLPANILLFLQLIHLEPEKAVFSKTSSFARLNQNIVVPFPYQSDNAFTDLDNSIPWDGPDFDAADVVVALQDSIVFDYMTPTGERWPLDTSRGVYAVNGIHNLHCVKSLRETVLEAYDNKPLSMTRRHVLHCIDWLRDDITCQADDTPLYFSREFVQRGPRGVNKARKCRDWGQLLDWAGRSSACRSGDGKYGNCSRDHRGR